MKTTLNNTLFGVLGLLMVIFGLNMFLGFIPVEPPADETAQQFLETMFTSYLFVVVAIAEVVGGILIVIKKTRLLGWFLLAPIVFNIVAFHVAHDFVGNGIWLLPAALFLAGGFFLKEESLQLLKLK
nr:hypothetical protein [Allomuricauda sp.]